MHTGGEDYEPGPYTVVFTAGMTSAVFNVSIYNDDNYENNETFDVLINIFSLPSNVTVGDTNRATVTIMNDDGKHIANCLLIYACTSLKSFRLHS